MSIAFRCPGCNQTYSAPDGMAGKTTTCKKCQTAMVIPAPAAAPTPRSPAAAPVRPTPAAPTPPSPLGAANLSDLLDDATAPAAWTPPPSGKMAPFRPAAKRGRGMLGGPVGHDLPRAGLVADRNHIPRGLGRLGHLLACSSYRRKARSTGRYYVRSSGPA